MRRVRRGVREKTLSTVIFCKLLIDCLTDNTLAKALSLETFSKLIVSFFYRNDPLLKTVSINRIPGEFNFFVENKMKIDKSL